LLIRFFPGRLSPLTLFLLAFPVALLCARWSWHFVEKPALALKSRSRTGRRDALTAS